MISRWFKSTPSVAASPGGLADVVLHVGAPKCGSSAIQRWCVTHRVSLAESGIYYPEHGLDSNGVSGGHSQLSNALVNGDYESADRLLKRWLSEAQRADSTLLLSAEGLFGFHEQMAALLSGYKVRVVAFLRHPAESLLANHNQGIKRHMETRRLWDYLSGVLGQPVGHLVGEPLLYWADQFGDDCCEFLPYASPSAAVEPIERVFLRGIGLSSEESRRLVPAAEPVTNRGYVKAALEFKRLLNTVLPGLPANMAPEIDRCLQGYSDRQGGQRGYEVGDLPIALRETLFEQLLQKMEPIVLRFPRLDPVAKVPSTSGSASGELHARLDLSGPMESLREELPSVWEKVLERVRAERDAGRGDYPFCKLMDIAGVPFSEPLASVTTGFAETQRAVFANSRSKEPDLLREMAVLLERQGALADALLVIERALEGRPNGPGIIKIRDRVKQKIALRLELDNQPG